MLTTDTKRAQLITGALFYLLKWTVLQTMPEWGLPDTPTRGTALPLPALKQAAQTLGTESE